MIRFGGRTFDGRKIIGLALGNKNLKRLKKGEPIYLDGKTVGAPGVVVVIAHAETSEKVMEEIRRVAAETGTTSKELSTMLEHAGVEVK